MATDLSFPSSPQGFSWKVQNGITFDLFGRVTRWTGKNERRVATHVFAKRKGAIQEDQEAAARELDVDLIFTGKDCAAKYQDFKAAVAGNPYGLIVHPVADHWQAFCKGPDESADFSHAVDEIVVRVSFIENELDAPTVRDVPSPASQAQVASAQSSAMQTTVAKFMGYVATARTLEQNVLNKVQGAVDTLDTASDALASVRGAITSVVGVGSKLAGAIVALELNAKSLASLVDNYVQASSDVFTGEGSNTSAGAASATNTLLGQVDDAAQTLEGSLVALSPTPAGCADAVSDVELLLADCLLLAEAVQSAQPKLIVFVNQTTSDIMTICLRRYGAALCQAKAAYVLSINSIPNPAAIPPGFRLLMPSS